MPGQEMRVRPVQRTIEMKDGRKFDAYTFGKRDTVPTRMDIAVQGIALDGKLAPHRSDGKEVTGQGVAVIRPALIAV